MAPINAPALIGHVLRLGGLWVVCAVLLDIIPYTAKQVRAITGLLQIGAQATQIATVI